MPWGGRFLLEPSPKEASSQIPVIRQVRLTCTSQELILEKEAYAMEGGRFQEKPSPKEASSQILVIRQVRLTYTSQELILEKEAYAMEGVTVSPGTVTRCSET